jgi:hypothetical protein
MSVVIYTDDMPADSIYLLDLGWLRGDKGWFLPGADGGGATRFNQNPERKLIN